MILNDTQVKRIADLGRTLPDSLLAPLVLEIVLGCGLPVATHAVVEEPQTAAPEPRATFERSEQVSAAMRQAAVVHHLKANPGDRIVDIQRALGCHRDIVRKAIEKLTQDGTVERRNVNGRWRYYLLAAIAPALQPEVLLTEQRIDGENKQRLVRVERRKGVAKPVQPANAKQRAIALVEYVRTHPGAAFGDFMREFGWGMGHLQYALKLAKESGELLMEGDRASAVYYVRGYVNGAAQAVTA
jgi:predicted DNA-binding transcriptional regulator